MFRGIGRLFPLQLLTLCRGNQAKIGLLSRNAALKFALEAGFNGESSGKFRVGIAAGQTKLRLGKAQRAGKVGVFDMGPGKISALQLGARQRRTNQTGADQIGVG